MPHRRADRRVVGAEGLHQHPAALVAATGPAGHLGHEVKGPLRRAEVGQVQGRVGLDHADQRHVGKIEPLGDHLRAQQDAGLALREIRRGPFRGPRGPASCRRPCGAAGRWGSGPALRPPASACPGPSSEFRPSRRPDNSSAARCGNRTSGKGPGRRAPSPGRVMRQRDVAVGTTHHLAAGRALDVRRIAAAIQQQDHLAVVLQGGLHRLVQQAADAAATAPTRWPSARRSIVPTSGSGRFKTRRGISIN